MTKHAAALLAALLLLLATSPPAGAATTPPIAAHRGATNVAGIPEGSLTAFRWAYDNGAAAVEVDLRWTKDARMVLLHDATLDRTTNCAGPVSSILYANLRKCASADVVPDFAAVLQLGRDRGRTVLVEPKPVLTDSNAHEAVERVNDYGMADRTVVYSFSTTTLNTMKRQPADVGFRYGLISSPGAAVSPPTARAAGTVYAPNWRDLTLAKVAAYRAAGVSLWVWASPDRYAYVRDLGVAVMIVDNPKAAVTWRNAQ